MTHEFLASCITPIQVPDKVFEIAYDDLIHHLDDLIQYYGNPPKHVSVIMSGFDWKSSDTGCFYFGGLDYESSILTKINVQVSCPEYVETLLWDRKHGHRIGPNTILFSNCFCIGVKWKEPPPFVPLACKLEFELYPLLAPPTPVPVMVRDNDNIMVFSRTSLRTVLDKDKNQFVPCKVEDLYPLKK